MKTVTINTKNITDNDSFHEEFNRVMGFIDGYGKNFDAWIDSMSDIQDNPETGMTKKVILQNGETLEIEITDTKDLYSRCPNLMKDLVECTAIVNTRYGNNKEGKSLVLKFLN